MQAKPVSKHAWNIQKVSHHIHRIGYHFRAEIVEQACEELGYVPLRDHKFVKPEDMNKPDKHTRLTETLAKYGINMQLSAETREPLDQVRAAIKELFPKIPEEDLNQIVNHAWQKGSDRVGTNSSMELPRRVQLAVIARIRHTYTDYDRLLRAFEWAEARKMVEPECLQKIIEWRGENDDQEDDEELEEIVRETIVIDDDDDDVIEIIDEEGDADDEDAADLDYISDTSIEIVHHIARDDDLGAESMDERSRAFHNRFLPVRRTLAQRSDIAKQKIDAARKRIRDGIPVVTKAHPQYGQTLPHSELRTVVPQHRLIGIREPTHTHHQVPHSIPPPPAETFPATTGDHRYLRSDLQREEIFVDGQRYVRDQPQPEYRYVRPWQEEPAHVQPQYNYGRPSLPRPTAAPLVPSTPQPYDRPVASIEHDGDYKTFDHESYRSARAAQRRAPPPNGAEIVDLTSPPRHQVYATVPQEQLSVYDRPPKHVQRVVYREQLPVHGAPAPVQYRVPSSLPGSAAPHSPRIPPLPADGAAAPTQYYYPR
nr:hypothetical protein CFP56_01029 [Quercus suber]